MATSRAAWFECRPSIADCREALRRLAAQVLPGEEASWAHELHDAVAQLERQTVQQRIDELQQKQRAQGLDETDKYEMRMLLQGLAGRG